MFSSTETFDMGSGNGGKYAMGESSNGFRVKFSTAFALTFLALVVAVGVGLIVHFAGGDKTVVCQCSCGAGSDQDGQVGCPPQTTVSNTCTPCPNSTTAPTTSSPEVTTTEPTPTTPPITSDVLLPGHLIPYHYNVVLRPNLYASRPEDFTLEGSVEIFVTCIESANNATIHIQNLNVTAHSINVTELQSNAQVNVHNFSIDESERHFLTMIADNLVMAGRNYSLKMKFSGPLQNNDLSGLYYSTYSEDGKDSYMAITQFQPTDARKAFPSFDEPGLKATFNITLERRADATDVITLSNMPIIHNNYSSTDGYEADVYDTTVVMPTYLLAFAVCNFPYKENVTKYNTTFRTYARKEYIEHTNYSLWVGSTLLDEFEDYFEIPYPLPKLDMIAIPDFSAGAMENWGLVTYREQYMFYHPNTTTAGLHMFVAIIVAHELAHMWFGNLVSPAWWDDLWLNEGFATFFEYLGVDMVETDWDMMNYMSYDCVQYAFETDSLESSRPIYQEVWTPSQINDIFDTITYFKGASVIRMMWFFLGEEVFRHGLSDYIRSRSYGSAQHDDLWSALTEESGVNGTGVDVRTVMDSWVEQKNYPVIHVTKNGASSINIRQERFLLHMSTDNNTYQWRVPITYTTNVSPTFDRDVHYRNITWLNDRSEQTIDTGSSFDWIILNIQQFGYYRVHYEQQIWDAIINQLNMNHKLIHVVNRGAVINDAWALNKAGMVNIETAIRTMDYLDAEEEYVPWAAAFTELAYVDRMLLSTSVYGTFKSFMIDKVNNSYFKHRLDISIDQPIQTLLLQSRISSRACKYGIQDCSNEAVRIFNEWKKNPDSYVIQPDTRYTVLCTALKAGTEADWDFLYSRYPNSSAADQRTFIDALSCSTETWILQRFLELSVGLHNDTYIRSQDARFVILGVASNPIGLNIALKFVRSHWKYLLKSSGISSFALNQVVIGLCRWFYSDYDVSMVESWKEYHDVITDPWSGFRYGIETIQNNKAWHERNYDRLANWLEEHYST